MYTYLRTSCSISKVIRMSFGSRGVLVLVTLSVSEVIFNSIFIVELLTLFCTVVSNRFWVRRRSFPKSIVLFDIREDVLLAHSNPVAIMKNPQCSYSSIFLPIQLAT